jgi:hypothetical protein
MMTERREGRQTTGVCDSQVGSAAMPDGSEKRKLALDALLALVPLGLSRSERLVAALPCLGLLRGRAGFVLAGVVIVFAVARAAAPGMAAAFERVSRRRAALFLVTSALVYGGVGLRYAAGVQVSGDEPHYLVMAQSLWRDHDLELRDEYEGEEWAEFMPGPLRPHWGAPRADGRPYPAHSPGLPLLLAPAYALGGRAGCVAVMALLGAATGLVCRELALRATGDPGAALVAWLAVSGPPLFFYAFHLYTELPSALALGLGLLLLTRSGGGGVRAAVGAALVASTLPWLHLKMIPAAAAVGLVAAWRLRGQALVAFLITAGTAAAVFGLYYLSVFGVPSPLAIYGGSVPPDARAFSWRAVAGLLLDRSYGLLEAAPVFLLALAGLGRLGRERNGWPAALVGIAVLVPAVSWRMWWGGQCPPARFLVPLLPVLGIAVASRVALGRSGLVRWWPGLLSLGFALAGVLVADPSARLLLNRGNRPTRLWAALSNGTPLNDYLPSLTHASDRDAKVALVWIAAVAALLALDVLARHRPRIDGLFKSVAAPLLALLLIGAAIDVALGPPSAAVQPPSTEPDP